MAFWMHLGCLGGHLGAQKMGRRIPTCEQPSEPTPWRGGRETLLGRNWKDWGFDARDLHALRLSASADFTFDVLFLFIFHFFKVF